MRRVRSSRLTSTALYKRAAAFANLCLALGLASAAAGCSAVIPLPSLISGDDVTGSIGASPSPLSSSLDAEDWRRARAALGVALDPQGNGAAVGWENPKSGSKGSFTPVGLAEPTGEKICRSFLAELGGGLPGQSLRGVACRDKMGDWSVNQVSPAKKA
jgi:surface antigen